MLKKRDTSTGIAFERRIRELSVTLYRNQGLKIWKTNPTVGGAPAHRNKETGKIIPSSMRFAKRLESDIAPDFVGYLTATRPPTPVFLETKALSVKDREHLKNWQRFARFPIGDPLIVKGHQHAQLRELEEDRGLAYYLIQVYEKECKMHSRCFLLSPGWAEFVWGELGKPTTVPLGRFARCHFPTLGMKGLPPEVSDFIEVPDLADLPKILKNIAKEE